MMIDADLLAAAMEAEERLIEAEHNAEVARAEFIGPYVGYTSAAALCVKSLKCSG